MELRLYICRAPASIDTCLHGVLLLLRVDALFQAV